MQPQGVRGGKSLDRIAHSAPRLFGLKIEELFLDEQ